jgi:hypothetical protein
VKGFAVRIHQTDEGVVVDVWDGSGFGDSPIASTYAFDSELSVDALAVQELDKEYQTVV